MTSRSVIHRQNQLPLDSVEEANVIAAIGTFLFMQQCPDRILHNEQTWVLETIHDVQKAPWYSNDSDEESS